MNNELKSIPAEQMLVFDIEVVAKTKTLDINSREFGIFQKKIRNKSTDEMLDDLDVVKEYERMAALKLCFNKVVSIGLGFIKGDKVYIKSISSDNEQELLAEFWTVAKQFRYLCGANIIGYDVPVLTTNTAKYFDLTEVVPQAFNVTGKKPWSVPNLVDLMDMFKGTHYANSGLDEMCMHFDIPSPKTDLDGSMVSKEYWTNGLEKIDKYVKQDVFATINLFRRMRHEPIFETFVDKSPEAKPVINSIINDGVVTENQMKKILEDNKGKEAFEIDGVVKLIKAAVGHDVELFYEGKEFYKLLYNNK
jgi:predicted PolB exonuclease-like 3'-5' exonuclease